MTGTVFAIEEFSTFDGPGIRMSVFLKGCPLRCTWCHNPEGQSAQTEYYRSPNGCLHCGACVRAGNGKLTPESIDACPRNLVRLCGETYTPEQLTGKLMKNAAILTASGGGVTFSGGEPAVQKEFLLSCLGLLEGKLHRAVQTCGYMSPCTFAQVLSRTEYILYDLKLMDPAKHRLFCGADNASILANYRTLAASGHPFVTRVPLIPGVTDTEENLGAMAAFLRENGVEYAELLNYNPMAGSKYAGLLRRYEPGFDESVPVQPRRELFAAYGVKAACV